MIVHVVKTREQLLHDAPLVTHNPDGTLTRAGALAEARTMWGDLGTISHGDDLPRLVWCIGEFSRTVGRGKTWEIAIERSRARKVKLDQKLLAEMRKEAANISVETPIQKVTVHGAEIA